MSFEIVQQTAGLGAEIRGIDISAPLDAAVVAGLRTAWLENLVLVFRGQSLSDDALVSFSRRFGELDRVPGWEPYSPDGHPEVLVVSNVKQAGTAIGVLGDGEAAWHTDMSYLADPPTASLLYSWEIPPDGGDTNFMNMYAALAAMPPELRGEIEHASLNHDSSEDSSGRLRDGFAPVSDVSQAPGACHPVIRVHPETGRQALFLGRRLNAYVLGMPVAESEELLDRIWQFCTQEQFVYRHRWKKGDLVMWDNRCTMHRRDPFDPASRRVMHRTQIKDPVSGAAGNPA